MIGERTAWAYYQCRVPYCKTIFRYGAKAYIVYCPVCGAADTCPRNVDHSDVTQFRNSLIDHRYDLLQKGRFTPRNIEDVI